MGTFGERLQREREMRGITLDEIAEATKIGTRLLLALEQEDFGKLPGGIFNKGFVRSYARFLGLDEDEAVSDYLTAIGEIPSQAKQPEPEVVAQQRAAAKASEAGTSERSAFLWPVIAALALIAVLLVVGWQLRRKSAAATSPPPSPTSPAPQALAPVLPQIETPAPAPPPASTVRPASEVKTETKPSMPAEAASFTLQIRARERSWVQVTADGKVVLDQELSAESQKSIRASRQIVLKTGNAAGVEISHNGRPQPALGGENQVRTVTFNSEGMER